MSRELSTKFEDLCIDAEKNKNIIRIIVKDKLRFDPTGKLFKAYLKRIENEKGLIDDHDGEDLRNDNDALSDIRYFDEQMGKLVRNFSSERYELLLKMAPHVAKKRKR